MKIDEQQIEQLRKKQNLKILAIESSCDETAVAIVEDGRKLLANVIASQIDIHTRFGGVVPEVASRNHITAISNVCNQALSEANLTLDDIDAIAVTYSCKSHKGAYCIKLYLTQRLKAAICLPYD